MDGPDEVTLGCVQRGSQARHRVCQMVIAAVVLVGVELLSWGDTTGGSRSGCLFGFPLKKLAVSSFYRNIAPLWLEKGFWRPGWVETGKPAHRVLWGAESPGLPFKQKHHFSLAQMRPHPTQIPPPAPVGASQRTRAETVGGKNLILPYFSFIFKVTPGKTWRSCTGWRALSARGLTAPLRCLGLGAKNQKLKLFN